MCVCVCVCVCIYFAFFISLILYILAPFKMTSPKFYIHIIMSTFLSYFGMMKTIISFTMKFYY